MDLRLDHPRIVSFSRKDNIISLNIENDFRERFNVICDLGEYTDYAYQLGIDINSEITVEPTGYIIQMDGTRISTEWLMINPSVINVESELSYMLL